MPSSISNSKDPLPNGSWGRTWRVALLLLLAALGGWEALWRAKGFSPSLKSNMDLWIQARSRVKGKSVVCIGASRIRSDLQPEAFAAEMGVPTPVHLGIPTASPLPMLDDLSGETSFAGLVIVDLIPTFIFDETSEREEDILQYIRAYHSAYQSPARLSEIQLRLYAQIQFTFLNPALSPPRIFSAAGKGAWPSPFPFSIEANRYTPVKFSGADNRKLEEKIYRRMLTTGRPATEEELKAILERIERAVSRIQQRGGNVILVRFPINGKVRQIEEQRYPRRDYWDALVAGTKAITIHSDDYPSLSNFHCPDGSHLDYRDARRFTTALAQIVKNKNSQDTQLFSALSSAGKAGEPLKASPSGL